MRGSPTPWDSLPISASPDQSLCDTPPVPQDASMEFGSTCHPGCPSSANLLDQASTPLAGCPQTPDIAACRSSKLQGCHKLQTSDASQSTVSDFLLQPGTVPYRGRSHQGLSNPGSSKVLV